MTCTGVCTLSSQRVHYAQGITPWEMCAGISCAGRIFVSVGEGGKVERERERWSQSRARLEGEGREKAGRSPEEMAWDGGGGSGRKCPCFLPAPAIHHLFLEGKSVFLPLLSPNVLNLEKKEQNPDKCILFSDYKCCIRFHPHTDVAASSRLLAVSVAGLGSLPPLLAVPAVSADGANEMSCRLATGGHLAA